MGCIFCGRDREYSMLSEILEQKPVFKTLCEKFFDKDLNIIADDLPMENWNRVVIAASGSSKNTGEIAKYFIENITRIPCYVDFASEFAHKDNVLNENDLFICISQSGNTADTFEALMRAKNAGAKTFAITNCAESKIHTNADFKVLADAGEEKSIAATKSFTAQIFVLYVFAMALAEKVQNKDLSELKKEFFTIADKYDAIFEQRKDIKKIAKRLKKAKSVALLGRNINSALAMEGALKTKETCYINANAAPAGEFLHGHFAFLDKQVPIIGILNKADGDEENYGLALHNFQEIKGKRKSDLILLKTQGDDNASKELKNEYQIEIPKISIMFTPFLNLVALQILAYETAKLLHDNIDEPRDLKKCVSAE